MLLDHSITLAMSASIWPLNFLEFFLQLLLLPVKFILDHSLIKCVVIAHESLDHRLLTLRVVF